MRSRCSQEDMRLRGRSIPLQTILKLLRVLRGPKGATSGLVNDKKIIKESVIVQLGAIEDAKHDSI